jgi:hypothetical protein
LGWRLCWFHQARRASTRDSRGHRPRNLSNACLSSPENMINLIGLPAAALGAAEPCRSEMLNGQTGVPLQGERTSWRRGSGGAASLLPPAMMVQACGLKLRDCILLCWPLCRFHPAQRATPLYPRAPLRFRGSAMMVQACSLKCRESHFFVLAALLVSSGPKGPYLR